MKKSNNINILLSYPRSGNHLVRFFIELLSEKPTYGCRQNDKDIEIYKNIFPEEIPFNIKDDPDSSYLKEGLYYKFHNGSPNIENSKGKMIFIIRNPKEVLVKTKAYKDRVEFKKYFRAIDSYLDFNGHKKILFYEDILSNKENFIKELYNFITEDDTKENKLKYVLKNIDKLYKLSAQGKNRSWDGYNSKGKTDFYYKQFKKRHRFISLIFLYRIYIKSLRPRYFFIFKKYFLNN